MESFNFRHLCLPNYITIVDSTYKKNEYNEKSNWLQFLLAGTNLKFHTQHIVSLFESLNDCISIHVIPFFSRFPMSIV